MRIKQRRYHDKIGPFRINRTGFEVKSVTVRVMFWTIVVWESK